MIRGLFLGMLVFVMMLGAFSTHCSFEEQAQSFAQKENTDCKNSMNIQEAVASVLNTGLICAMAGGIAYHVVNKMSESPQIWEPILLDCFLGAGFLGCIYTVFFVCKKGQKYRILCKKNNFLKLRK